MDQPNTAPQPIIETPTRTVVEPVVEEKRLLLEWEAPSRPFKKRDKDFFTTITVMAILFIVILLFMKEFLVVLVIVAFLFLVYVLSTVPPENIKNSIYTTGLQTGIHSYSWADLMYYTFDYKWGQPMLVARTKARLPGAVYMLLADQTREKLEELIGTRLPLREAPENTWMDQTATWLSKKVPLEKSTEQ